MRNSYLFGMAFISFLVIAAIPADAAVTLSVTPEQELATGVTQDTGYDFIVGINITNQGPETVWRFFIRITDDSYGDIAPITPFGMLPSCGWPPIQNESESDEEVPAPEPVCEPVLKPGESFYTTHKIKIKPKTWPKEIDIRVNTTWWDYDDGSTGDAEDFMAIYVYGNPVIEIIEDEVSTSIQNGETGEVDVTVASTGNDYVSGVEMILVGGNMPFECPLCDIEFNPVERYEIMPGDNFTVDIKAHIPAGQEAGNYWTLVAMNATADKDDYALLNITVPVDDGWTSSPSNFGTIYAPRGTSGTIGVIDYANTGNVNLILTFGKGGNTPQYVMLDGTAIKVPEEVYPQVEDDVTLSFFVPENALTGLHDNWVTIRAFNADGTPATPLFRQVTFRLNVTDDVNEVPPAPEFPFAAAAAITAMISVLVASILASKKN